MGIIRIFPKNAKQSLIKIFKCLPLGTALAKSKEQFLEKFKNVDFGPKMVHFTHYVLKGIVKRTEPCKCVALLVSRIL